MCGGRHSCVAQQYPASSEVVEIAGNAIEQLSALERLARAEMLPLVRTLVSEDSLLQSDGCRSVGSWLSMRLGMSHSSARDLEIVAVATATLPSVLAAFVSGSLSWDKLVLVCSFATTETDEELASVCPAMTIRQLRELSRRAQELSDEEVVEVHKARVLQFKASRDGRTMKIDGRVPIEQGIVIRDAVESVGNGSGPQSDGTWLAQDQLNADALFEICSGELGDRAGHDSAVVIEADISVLEGSGTADIGRDGLLSPEQVRRVLCSSPVELSVMKGGKTIGSGRKTRLFPPKVMRALQARDQGCRFPGCHRRRWVQGHHIKEWNQGGESNENNGLMLCWFHHAFVHEHGWRIEGDVYGVIEFIRPDARRFAGVPPAATAEVREAFEIAMRTRAS